jgi:hypothetical protein
VEKKMYNDITAARKKIFFSVIRRTGNASKAANEAGFSKFWAYNNRKRDPEFAKQWDQAYEEYVDYLEEVCGERAARDEKPSDLLMMFRLKAERPHKYRDNYQAGPNIVNVFQHLDVKQLIHIAQQALDNPQEGHEIIDAITTTVSGDGLLASRQEEED